MRNQRQSWFVAGLVLWMSMTAHAESAKASGESRIDGKKIELARYAKAFVGQGNVTVEVAPYKQGDHRGAILLFKGIESEWDGRAIKHTVETSANFGEKYITQRNGRTWETLISVKDDSGSFRYELYVPGVNNPIALAPSDGAAQLTTPDKIFTEYQNQQRSKK